MPTMYRTTTQKHHHVDEIFKTLTNQQNATPYSDWMTILVSKARAKPIEKVIAKLNKEAREAMQSIEKHVGDKYFYSSRSAHDEKYTSQITFMDELQDLRRDLEYFATTKYQERLQESCDKFMEFLNGYYDTVLDIETHALLEKACNEKDKEIVYPEDEADFEVIEGRIQWDDRNEIYHAAPEVPEEESETRAAMIIALAKQGEEMILTKLMEAISVMTNQIRFRSRGHEALRVGKSRSHSVNNWKTPLMRQAIANIQASIVRLAGERLTTSATFSEDSDIMTIITIISKRSLAIVELFKEDIWEEEMSEECGVKALISWLEYCLDEFAQFISDYSAILSDDDVMMRYPSSQVYHDDGVLNFHPTAGQHWRSKYVKSLDESETDTVYERATEDRPMKFVPINLGDWKTQGFTLKSFEIYFDMEDVAADLIPKPYYMLDTQLKLRPHNLSKAEQRKYGNNAQYPDQNFQLIDLKPEIRQLWMTQKKMDIQLEDDLAPSADSEVSASKLDGMKRREKSAEESGSEGKSDQSSQRDVGLYSSPITETDYDIPLESIEVEHSPKKSSADSGDEDFSEADDRSEDGDSAIEDEDDDSFKTIEVDISRKRPRVGVEEGSATEDGDYSEEEVYVEDGEKTEDEDYSEDGDSASKGDRKRRRLN